MPADATPLDFAYHVHTDVGHRCRGAKINGRIVTLTTKIRNGDQVEIITGSKPHPSRDWLSPRLGYLASSRSRAKVRNWFRGQDREQHLRQGREILERELSRLNVRDLPTDAIAKQLKQKDTESLCVLLGSSELAAAVVATAVQQLRGDEARQPVPARRQKPSESKPDGVSVSGVGDLLCNFARCCRPVPPERIAGYITQGRGVTIHRQDCGNYLGLLGRHRERVIAVDWGKADAGNYPVDLRVRAFDRSGLIRDITLVLADEKANILDLKSHTDKQNMQVVMRFSIEIADLPTLSTAIARIEQIPNVVSVERRT
jgi:GTP pyrophosphokinase